MTKTIKKSHVWEKAEHDWYIEPVKASIGLFCHERFIGGIWDPSCGQGNILEAAIKCGYGNRITGTDLVRRRDRWFITGGIDFLSYDGQPKAQNIVCNPPFGRGATAEKFIRKALALATGKVAMFVEVRFLGGKARAQGLFAEVPPSRIWQITPRQSCPPGTFLQAGGKASGGTADHVWIVWDMSAPEGDTTWRWMVLK